MTELARFINASGLSPDDFGDMIDVKTIQDSTTELGNDEYRVRQLASSLYFVDTVSLPDVFEPGLKPL